MPETFPQWLWFGFFFGAALASYAVAGVVLYTIIQTRRLSRRQVKP